MQQPDPIKPQQEQYLQFSFLEGSTDPAPASDGAFCLGCGHRHKSKGRWQPGTVVVDENSNVEVRASGRTILSGGVEHSLKQQALLDSLSVHRHHISELQLKCRPGQFVYPKVQGKNKTAVCSASYQKLGKVHEQRNSNRPHGSYAAPATSQAVLLPPLRSGVQLREVTQQLNAEKLQHQHTRDKLAAEQDKLAAEQQQHSVTRQELLDAQQQYDSMSADVGRLLRQLDLCEEQNAQLQQQQQAVSVDIEHQSLQQHQLSQFRHEGVQAKAGTA